VQQCITSHKKGRRKEKNAGGVKEISALREEKGMRKRRGTRRNRSEVEHKGGGFKVNRKTKNKEGRGNS